MYDTCVFVCVFAWEDTCLDARRTQAEDEHLTACHAVHCCVAQHIALSAVQRVIDAFACGHGWMKNACTFVLMPFKHTTPYNSGFAQCLGQDVGHLL